MTPADLTKNIFNTPLFAPADPAVGVFAGDPAPLEPPDGSPLAPPTLPPAPMSQLDQLKARIDLGREQIAGLESQLRPAITELNEMSAQMKELEAELDALDEQNKAGLSVDTDDYNAKVESHNQILQRRNVVLAGNRADLAGVRRLATARLRYGGRVQSASESRRSMSSTDIPSELSIAHAGRMRRGFGVLAFEAPL